LISFILAISFCMLDWRSGARRILTLGSAVAVAGLGKPACKGSGRNPGLRKRVPNRVKVVGAFAFYMSGTLGYYTITIGSVGRLVS
jgi:hypothetical protein